MMYTGMTDLHAPSTSSKTWKCAMRVFHNWPDQSAPLDHPGDVPCFTQGGGRRNFSFQALGSTYPNHITP